MSKTTLIRAWKDEEYRLGLDELVESPVGSLELMDADLEMVAGQGGCALTFVGKCWVTIGICLVTICFGSFNAEVGLGL